MPHRHGMPPCWPLPGPARCLPCLSCAPRLPATALPFLSSQQRQQRPCVATLPQPLRRRSRWQGSRKSGVHHAHLAAPQACGRSSMCRPIACCHAVGALWGSAAHAAHANKYCMHPHAPPAAPSTHHAPALPQRPQFVPPHTYRVTPNPKKDGNMVACRRAGALPGPRPASTTSAPPSHKTQNRFFFGNTNGVRAYWRAEAPSAACWLHKCKRA